MAVYVAIWVGLGVFTAFAGKPKADADSIRIALFTDPHFTKARRMNTTPRMPQLAQDANHRIAGINFARGLGDEVHDHAGWIGIWNLLHENPQEQKVTVRLLNE